MAIDTHIYRVSQRLGIIGPKVNVEKAHDLLEAAVEPEMVYTFHVAFINHGRQVCKAQRPRCEECAVAYGCPAKDQFLSPKEPVATAKGKKSPKASKTKPITSPARDAGQVPHAYPSEGA